MPAIRQVILAWNMIASIMRRFLLLALLSLTFPAAASAVVTPSGAVCHELGGREPPTADRPTPAQISALNSCDSEALYYGEKGPPDFIKARLCAFQEDGDGKGTSRKEGVFAGQTILMQIYANGLGGVKRDLDQATAYACAIEGAPAEVDYRVQHLQTLKTKPETKRFDYCDDITSGLAGGFCAARNAEIAKKGRAAETADVVARVPPAAKPALAALRKASAAFVDAHDGEVDQTGTARAQEMIDEEEAQRDAFTAHLAQLIDGRWPQASAARAKDADDALNATYKKALAFLASKNNFTTVKPDDARKAQRAWIVYRDAFMAFARAATPKKPPEAVTDLLTRERTKNLADLAS
jgi:uncharacterized protein YecT (DUF1311 family)